MQPREGSISTQLPRLRDSLGLKGTLPQPPRGRQPRRGRPVPCTAWPAAAQPHRSLPSPCLSLSGESRPTDLGRLGLEGGLTAFGPSSGALAWGLCRGVRRWRVSRCPARHSSPAAGPGPGSCPAAAPVGGCSLSAAAGASAPGGPSRSKSCGAGCTTRGPPTSRRGGPMTRSCPHPWPPRRPTTWGRCRPASGGRAPQCSQTRLWGEIPSGRLPAGGARATSRPPWHHLRLPVDRACLPLGERGRHNLSGAETRWC